MLKLPRPTGKKFLTSLVAEGHKKGIFCLRCGMYAGTYTCQSCVGFKDCDMCGIVCRPMPRYKIYSYIRLDKKFSKEYIIEESPFCKRLENGLCEDCVCWEDFIRDKCFVCGDIFENSRTHFTSNGNYCLNCKNGLYNDRRRAD